MVYYSPKCIYSFCLVNLVETGGATPKRDSSGIQLCECCERRLCRTKGNPHTCKSGLQCHPCYLRAYRAPLSKRPVSIAVEEVAPESKRIRRTVSDPGEPSNLAHRRIRALSFTHSYLTKKMRVKSPAVNVSLDELHARRLLLIRADTGKSDAHGVVSNTSAVVFE